ncbi:hypothetical protein CPAST_c14610 [Clostridium pasteurianum DSM 525 = ATCC 6013]|uniref:DUF5668 domain-containing protein n=1 Tax=Clostridium pasteurianum DSM 525 = ATCC 6013 TaxID=1262449 RepID=A0A0H3J104_CLOPA|nr:hypothetical protein [Clostridium pasteurianum]AJA47536.1 hypothetical protein CPAST_c14610 [Clostridium pasteurianum DSM 525 = ATCC 6013]AJA51524.1 hypothetical protein CLPA_c14610 [Clostridium pasteurianum DSM 525 = ATCC 6013]AOZ74852.1 hypothetical protein AQ983_07055 [Clostridium pasteurianum DSM 525 = ATCC 6013]AOZ78647.1 hypothetical protein AQ984_07045 [Clostridium pasteurianum]ELP58123.1 hypothetical protein F502_16790 [Clostridium pasteurianum DSM 525 = ATCC 6013]
MKKTGTLTLALSLIYYGIWLAFTNINNDMAKKLFIFWPAVFILLGMEVLVNFREINSAKKVGFNVGIIFMILLFFITSLIYQKYNNPFDSIIIDNNPFKNININTWDKNTDANLICNIGQCSFNEEIINRGNLIKTIGNGSNKIKVNLNMGSIKVNSQE